MINRFIIFLLIGVTLFGLVGCGQSKSTNKSEDAGKKILRATTGAPQTLDQHLVTDAPGWNILEALTENLIKMDYKNDRLMPAVAERWVVSEDARVFTFYLRKDAKWSNGETVTASDFVYSWERMLSPGLGNHYAIDYYPIENAQAFHTGELKDFSKVGVKAVSETELQFTLSSNDPMFLKRVASPVSTPVHPATVDAFGDMDDPTNQWIRAGNHVGNGPFRLVQWELNKIIKLEKNPHYWNARAVKLDGISFNPAETEVIEERLYRSGQIDINITGRVPTEKRAYYLEERPGELVDNSAYATYFYLFNTKKAPFDDVNVRKAFTYAVDRQLITDKVTKNQEKIATALSPYSATYSPPEVNLYDPEKAKAYLAKAGYPNGEGFPQITLTYNTMDSHRKIAIAIQQMWKKVLNVSVQIENQEWKVFLSNRQNLEHQIARAGSFSSFLDPADFLDSYTTGHGMNHTGWSNAEYDALIKRASSETDNKKRFEYLYQAEEILIEELPILPLYYYVTSYLISPRVKGYEFNAADRPNFVPVDLVDIPDA